MKFVSQSADLRRFDIISSDGINRKTIVKVKKDQYSVTYTIKNIKWSKYKFINKLIRLWIKIRYI